MLISRCAWHPFFRGYPRPLRVVSWRGPGVAFSDTICRSCAARVRIEGLWASSPPKPVWPGSAQTALLFVGLPLLWALVLMAAPLHDAGPPPAREETLAALVAAEAPLIEALPDDPAPVTPAAYAPPVIAQNATAASTGMRRRPDRKDKERHEEKEFVKCQAKADSETG